MPVLEIVSAQKSPNYSVSTLTNPLSPLEWTVEVPLTKSLVVVSSTRPNLDGSGRDWVSVLLRRIHTCSGEASQPSRSHTLSVATFSAVLNSSRRPFEGGNWAGSSSLAPFNIYDILVKCFIIPNLDILTRQKCVPFLNVIYGGIF